MEFKDIYPFLYDVGYGAFVGFIIGFTVKRVFKFLVIISGLYILSLFWLSSKEFISVNWDVLFNFMNSSFVSMEMALKNVVKAFAFSSAFAGGFVIGLKV